MTSDNTPEGLSARSAAGWSLLIVVVGLTAWGSRFYFRAAEPVAVPPPAEPSVASPAQVVPSIDWEAWRRRAWTKVEPRIDEAERAAAAALVEELAAVDRFFQERRAGVRPFAEQVLSFGGKWAYVKSKMPTADDEAHLRYLNEQFEKHLFKIDDLRRTVESAVAAYVSRVEGIENQLLADIRSDLSDGSLGIDAVPRFAAGDGPLKREFDRLLAETAADVSRDFGVTVSREVTSLVAGEVAAVVAVRVATAVAARLGVSAGVLGTGAAAGWATFGVGLVAAIVIDAVIDRAVRAAGYDPVEKVAAQVDAVLGQVRGLLVDGDPDARAAWEKLKQMAADDPDETVRAECRRAAESIHSGGQLGLRHELLKLQEGRARIRREALRRLVFTAET